MHTTNWIVSFNSIMNTSESNKQTSSPAHLYDSFQTAWQVSARKEFGILKAAPMRPVIWRQRIFASLIKRFFPHSASTSHLFWLAVPHKTNQQILQGASGCMFVAPCSSLLAPRTCQVWKSQEGPTIWAAGGVFPRETPGQMVVATPALVIVQRKSPVAPVNLLTTDWSEMKSYTGIPSIKFLSHFESLVLTSLAQITWGAKG